MDNRMDIRVQHSTGEDHGRFYIAADTDSQTEGNDEPLGYLDYRSDNGTVTVEHTVVSDELKGTGAGRKLVDEFMQFATDHRYEIKSTCDYASHVMKKYYDIDES